MKTLFRFVKQVASLAQKLSAAGLAKVSNLAGYGFAGWKHVVLHYLRIELEQPSKRSSIGPPRWTAFALY